MPAFMAYGIANLAFILSIPIILIGILLSKGSAATSRTWTLFALAIIVIGSLARVLMQYVRCRCSVTPRGRSRRHMAGKQRIVIGFSILLIPIGCLR